MNILFSVLPLLLIGCAASRQVGPEAGSDGEQPSSAPINSHCPRSGRPVVADSLAEYRGYVVGFCNQHCRDDFAANVSERPSDTDFFDALIVKLN